MFKIVFLDMDGVVNSRRWFKFLQTKEGAAHKIKLEEQQRGSELQRLDHEIYYTRMVDPNCAKHLAALINDTGAKIVISSTWRLPVRKFDALLFYRVFANVGHSLPVDTILGCTPELNSRRGHEIQCWMYRNPEYVVDKYVILDDDIDMLPEQPFVHINRSIGLTRTDVETCKRYLL